MIWQQCRKNWRGMPAWQQYARERTLRPPRLKPAGIAARLRRTVRDGATRIAGIGGNSHAGTDKSAANADPLHVVLPAPLADPHFTPSVRNPPARLISRRRCRSACWLLRSSRQRPDQRRQVFRHLLQQVRWWADGYLDRCRVAAG